jgi:hypothetical protein
MPFLAHDMLGHDMFRHDMLGLGAENGPRGCRELLFLKRGSKIREQTQRSLRVTVGLIKVLCLDRDEEKWKPVFRPHPTLAIDHGHDFGLIQFKIIVI